MGPSGGTSIVANRGNQDHGEPLLGLNRRVRRMLDVVAAAMILTLFSPILLVTSVAIKLDSGGPVFIRETQYKRNSRVIQVFRFRFLRAPAEGDCSYRRLTWVGRILRGTGIDELPLLVNVLRGEMAMTDALGHQADIASEKQTQAIGIIPYRSKY